MANSRGHRAVTIACFVALFILYLAFLWPGVLYYAFGDDQSIYLVSAKALASRQGYRLISDVAAPPAAMYPIGYPAMLAPLFLWSDSLPQVIPLARFLSLTLCVALIVVGYALLCRYTTRQTALLLSLLIGLTPQVFLFSTSISSEWPFAALSLFGLLLVCRGNESRTPDSYSRYALAAGAFIGAGMLMRTVGAAFVVGVACCYVINRRWRNVASFVVGVVVVYALSIASWSSDGGNTFLAYREWFLTNVDLKTPLVNFSALVLNVLPAILVPPMETIFARQLLGGGHAYVMGSIGAALGVVLLIGLWSQLRRMDPLGVCLGCYLAVVMMWPWDPSRFVLPVLPLFLVTAMEGINTTMKWLVRDRIDAWPRSLFYGGLVLLCALALAADGAWMRRLYLTGHHAGSAPGGDWNEMRSAFEWIKANTPPDAVLVSSYPEGAFLFTGRKTLRQPVDAELEGILSTHRTTNTFVFATKRISYRRRDQAAEFGLSPVLTYAAARPGRLLPRWRNDDGTIQIFEVVGYARF